jgi:membrane protease subunit (stomatin/prohibitin family)
MAIINSIYWDQKDSDELVHKYDSHEITLGSVLTVNESQEAYLYKSGTLYNVYRRGRHVLSTSNIPILNKLINLPSGGKTTFVTEIWFISLLDKRNMYWGTGNLRVIDPYFEIPVKIFARGTYGIRINDSSLFMRLLVGNAKCSSSDEVKEQFRVTVVEAVKVSISRYMKEKGININELGTEFPSLSTAIYEQLRKDFLSYGIVLLNFDIEDISFDESDPGYQKVMDGIAEQIRLKKLGVNYVQNRKLDIAEAAAGNEGAGNFMGIGMGMSIGQTIGNMVNSTIQQCEPVPPVPQQDFFYVAVNGQTTGPFPLDAIKQDIVQGRITGNTYIFKVGGKNWNKAEVEFPQLFSPVPPPPPQQ